jgi:hypothetical protein
LSPSIPFFEKERVKAIISILGKKRRRKRVSNSWYSIPGGVDPVFADSSIPSQSIASGRHSQEVVVIERKEVADREEVADAS